MKYGHFSDDGLEYIVTNPNTPRPWINYLTNEHYCLILSQSGSGYSFYKDCRTDRITRWHPEDYMLDRPGRFIYAKETDSNNRAHVWGLTYQPIRQHYKSYRCRHGLGYTTIEQDCNDIESSVTYFVPSDDDKTFEVWLIKVKNTANTARDIELYPYVEWLLGDYHQELRYRNIMNLYNRVWRCKENEGVIYAKKTAWWQDMGIQSFKGVIYFATDAKVTGYATQKCDFLGRYNTEQKPDGVYDGFKSSEICSGEDGIGCFRIPLHLAAGQSKEFVVLLGQCENPDHVKAEVFNKYLDVGRARKELEKTKEFWKNRIADNIVVKTPDKDFDTMVNVWLKYQLYICNLWSRSPSFYHEGSGGRGYRDSCQDSESIASINSKLTRKRIRQIASLIRKDGTSAPGWGEVTGPAKHRPNKDHQIWLTYTVAAYIKETGDKHLLLEEMPYLKDAWRGGWTLDLNWKKGAIQDGKGTLFEHLERNANFCFNDVGEKGMPLIGHADWNDAIDAAGIKLKGESIWLAFGIIRTLKVLAELAELIGKDDKAKDFLKKAQIMTDRVNKHGWNGHWYVRGYTDDGTVYGNHTDAEGKIYINPQAWSILAGVPDKPKLKKILDAVSKYLDGKHGLALFWPAYSHWNSKLGRISMFSEGTKENAAVFCHASTFMAVAYFLAGKGEEGYRAMTKIMPNKQPDYELYKSEPYVYSEYLIGPQHPYRYGEGAFTWITGASGWNFMAATEWLLGARRDYEGLRIDPCLPKGWKKCSIRRPFRDAIYDIEIYNPKGKTKGVKQVTVDGKPIKGNLIKPVHDGKAHKVKVVMG